MSNFVHARLGVSQEAISDFCRRWKIIEFALFGSAVREDFRDDSDVDVLVSFVPEGEPHLRDLVAMEEELRGLFGRKVDLVEKRFLGLNPYRRHNILADHQVIYPQPTAPTDVIREGSSRLSRDLGCVWDMIVAGREISEIIRRDDVDARMSQLAIERLLSIIGEAARGLSAEFRIAHPQIPWSDIIAERNVIVHNYRGVEVEKMWSIALAAVPDLVARLEHLIANPP